MKTIEERETRARVPDIPALTGMRFVAAAYVVLFHAWPVFMPSLPGPRYWNQFVSLGYVAVSFFFVLSGFILSTVYLRSDGSGRFNRRAFWQARFARIYPAYLVSLVASAPFCLVNVANHGRLYHAIKVLFLTLTNGALLQAWHPVLSGNWNRPSWSVSVEMFFYLLFPTLGVWIAKAKSNPIRLAGLAWLLAMAISLVCLRTIPTLSADLYRMEIFIFDPLLRLPEFVLGICCAVWCSRRRHQPPMHFAVGGILLFLAAVPLLVRLPWLLVSNGLLAPLFGMIIVIFSGSSGSLTRAIGSRLMVRLGHASFSLYLLHFPVLYWMSFAVTRGNLSERLAARWPMTSDSPAWLLLYCVLILSAALASYSFIETPARHAVKAWLTRRSTRRIKLQLFDTQQEFARR